MIALPFGAAWFFGYEIVWFAGGARPHFPTRTTSGQSVTARKLPVLNRQPGFPFVTEGKPIFFYNMITIFDTETNGLPLNYQGDPRDLWNWPRVCQLAFCRYDMEGNILQEYNAIIKPDGWVIHDRLAAIHGITQEIATKEGIPVQFALENFVRSLEKSELIVAHNMGFDHPIVCSEMIRAGIRGTGAKRKICTMLSTVDFCQFPGHRGGYKWPKLMELHYKLFGCEFDGAHNALFDVHATAKCFFELVRIGIIKL